VFPAGTYSVERLTAANPNLVILKQSGGKAKAVLLIQPLRDLTLKPNLKLSFKNSGNRYVLIGILAVGEKYTDPEMPPDDDARKPQNGGKSVNYILNPDVFAKKQANYPNEEGKNE